MGLTYAELFAGAGGLSMGLEAAGFHPVAHAEIEPNARAVLRYRWPQTRLDGDVTKVNGADYAGITLLSGGSPCQDLSVAGKRAGLTGSRSSLFHEQCRIWNESGAPYFLWENVYGAFSSNGGRDFATVLSAIVGAPIPVPEDGWRAGGVAAGSNAVAAWRVLDLQHFGPPQRRVRVFVLAARAGGVDPAEVLALSEGVCGHPSPRQQARPGAAGHAGGGAESRGVAIGVDGEKNAAAKLMGTLHADSEPSEEVFPTLGAHTQGDQAPHVVAIGGEVVPPLVARSSRGHAQCNTPSSTTDGQVVICTTGDVAHAMAHECAEASEDRTGRSTPVVAYSRGGYGAWAAADAVTSLCARDAKDQSSIVLPTKQQGRVWPKPITDTLTVAYAEKWGLEDQHINSGAGLFQQTASGRPRRLTPLECERLMSWPDEWTRYGMKEDGTVYELSDTARYRLCGNGVGSVCVEWIAQRLADAIAQQNGHLTEVAA